MKYWLGLAVLASAAAQGPAARVSILQFTDPACASCVTNAEILRELENRHGSSLIVTAKPMAENADLARALGVTALPTLFVNGRRLDGPVDAVTLGRVVDLAMGKLLADKPASLNVQDSPMLGSSAQVPEITVFSDFQCPYCSSMAPLLTDLAKAGEARVRFKHFPLSFHTKAPAAHGASIAAGKQGKFWEMHDRLFAEPGKLNPESFDKYAEQLGLNLDQFRRDAASAKQAIEADVAEGERIGVEGTPSLFINGRQFLGRPSRENIRAALQSLSGANPVTPEPPLLTLVDPASATSTLEWFFDAHSELTADSAAIMRALLKEPPSNLRVVARHLPMPFHPNNKLTHQALALAHEQSQFWPFLEMVLNDRTGEIGAERLKSIAMRLGLDYAAFSAKFDRGLAAPAVERDQLRAREISVRGVPTLVLNGKVLDGLPTLTAITNAVSESTNQ